MVWGFGVGVLNLVLDVGVLVYGVWALWCGDIVFCLVVESLNINIEE